MLFKFHKETRTRTEGKSLPPFIETEIFQADVLLVEYPGYGVYDGEANAKTILEDAEIVFDFLTTEAGMDP